MMARLALVVNPSFALAVVMCLAAVSSYEILNDDVEPSEEMVEVPSYVEAVERGILSRSVCANDEGQCSELCDASNGKCMMGSCYCYEGFQGQWCREEGSVAEFYDSVSAKVLLLYDVLYLYRESNIATDEEEEAENDRVLARHLSVDITLSIIVHSWNHYPGATFRSGELEGMINEICNVKFTETTQLIQQLLKYFFPIAHSDRSDCNFTHPLFYARIRKTSFDYDKGIRRLPNLPTEDSLINEILKGEPFLVSRGEFQKPITAHGTWTPEWFSHRYGRSKLDLQRNGVEQKCSMSAEVDMEGYIKYLKYLEDAEDISPSDIFYFVDTAPFQFKEESITMELAHPFFNHTHEEFPPGVLFIGPKGSMTGTHFDIDGMPIFHQIYGTKKVYIFPPDQTEFLYPSTKFDPGAGLAEVTANSPDLSKHPKFAQARPIVVTVNAGESLHIPPGWWHMVIAETTSISASRRGFLGCDKARYAHFRLLSILHQSGFYRFGKCVCHDGGCSPKESNALKERFSLIMERSGVILDNKHEDDDDDDDDE